MDTCILLLVNREWLCPEYSHISMSNRLFLKELYHASCFLSFLSLTLGTLIRGILLTFAAYLVFVTKNSESLIMTEYIVQEHLKHYK